MREAIIRLNNKKDDAELCIKQNEKITFKMLSKEELVKLFNDFFIKDQHEKANIKLFSENTIGAGIDYTVIKQPEHMQYVTYNNHSYKINFPNAIYIVRYDNKIVKGIQCYCYKKYKVGDTELYEYAMPNMLTGNAMCMGSADKRIVDDDIEGALNKIIATPYSHSNFDGIKGFSTTVSYFEYLEENPFPYKLLRKLLLEWGKDNYLPLKKKIAYLENENYRLRMQNLRIKERNERLTLIVKKRRKEAN